MPKSSKPRKKYTRKPKARVIEKVPYCKICNKDTRLATDAELAHFRAIDSSFDLPFLFVPQCNCWAEHEEWMAL